MSDFTGKEKKGEILNLKAALEMVGDEKELLIDLLNAFVNDSPFSTEKLADIQSKNLEEAAKYVHYYKGAARQIGAEQLAASGQALEDVLRGKKTGNIEQLTKNFKECYEVAQEAVNDTLLIL
ncbi:MAG: Hpt domain-containing protein [Treponema sp.]|nr:Hpt domain-containing protein [Treponema sp.]